VTSVGIAYSLSNDSWNELISALSYAEEKKVNLFQIHPLEPIGRASKEASPHLSYSILKQAYVLFHLISCNYPFIIQPDILNKANAIKSLIPRMDKNDPADIIDLLVMDEKGNVFPYTYGVPSEWVIVNIKKDSLLKGWSHFENKLQAFTKWCQSRLESLENELLTPSYMYT
jgi:hypothetical protein